MIAIGSKQHSPLLTQQDGSSYPSSCSPCVNKLTEPTMKNTNVIIDSMDQIHHDHMWV